MIAYTPETYVVLYGTDNSTLDGVSDTVYSGSDFKKMDQMFLVDIIDLQPTTIYYYQLVANNSLHTTLSNTGEFWTSDTECK